MVSIRSQTPAERTRIYPEPGGDTDRVVKAVDHLVTERTDDPAPVEELEAGLERDCLDASGLQRQHVQCTEQLDCNKVKLSVSSAERLGQAQASGLATWHPDAQSGLQSGT